MEMAEGAELAVRAIASPQAPSANNISVFQCSLVVPRRITRSRKIERQQLPSLATAGATPLHRLPVEPVYRVPGKRDLLKDADVVP